MNRFRLLEHTADMGIEVEGESLAALFEQAAWGLRALISESRPLPPGQAVTVELAGADPEELLVNWLSELLYLFEIRHLLPVSLRIEQIAPTRLRARVEAETIDPEHYPVEREVKAITYHQIRVEQTQGGWRARLYVDL
jgi:SHS2 domain-containing protein